MAEHNDYAVGCTAIAFVLEQAWDAFVAWSEATVGMSPPRDELKEALVALDRRFQETRDG